MDTVAIIQARMGSTRLPGKVLMDIAGKPMLERVIERVRTSNLVHKVVVATTTLPEDDVIAQHCSSMPVPCPTFRGAVDDVLARYARCAEAYDADHVIRVTADCPLVDPRIMEEVLHISKTIYGVFYAATDGYCWPNGVDAEAFSFSALARADMRAHKPYQRVHVTPYMREHFRCAWCRPVDTITSHPEMRWTVDTQEDLDFVREIYAHGWQHFRTDQLITVLLNHPELMRINAHVRQKDVTEC